LSLSSLRAWSWRLCFDAGELKVLGERKRSGNKSYPATA